MGRCVKEWASESEAKKGVKWRFLRSANSRVLSGQGVLGRSRPLKESKGLCSLKGESGGGPGVMVYSWQKGEACAFPGLGNYLSTAPVQRKAWRRGVVNLEKKTGRSGRT